VRGKKKGLTKSRLYGNFCTERNNRNDRPYKSNAFTCSSKIHPPLGRDGHPLGHQPHRRAGSTPTPLPFASSPLPLPADEISTTLAVARSNVSTCLRELQGWGIVRVVHVLGDRRDHFESIKDVWEIFRIVSEERKRREIDPTLRVLAECVVEAKAHPTARGKRTRGERLETMLEFLTVMTGLFDECCACRSRR